MIAWVGSDVFQGDASVNHERWFAGLIAAGVLVSVTAFLRWLKITPRGLLIGKDGRLSTSKLQVFLWTYALLGVLFQIIIARWLGATASYDALIDNELPQEYLILLGGPFAAAIASKAIVGKKVEDGVITKPDADPGETTATTRITEAVSDDEGNTDLVDTQYLLFNLLALVYFIGAFIDNPDTGLPTIPSVIVALTGVSAATYVSNKAVQRDVPVFKSLIPAKGAVGTEVEIFGQNLLIPDPLESDTYEEVAVMFGGIRADPVGLTADPNGKRKLVVDENAAPGKAPVHELSGDDRFFVKVPDGKIKTGEKIKVLVVNYKGVESETRDFVVLAPEKPKSSGAGRGGKRARPRSATNGRRTATSTRR